MIYNIKSEHLLPITIDQAWEFFSSAKNLSKITPPEMSFIIKTDLSDREVYEGLLIDYTVKPILGIPLPWRTEIYKVDRPNVFADRQLRGPYKMWDHTHSFVQTENGVLVKDDVNYELPLGFLGDIAHVLFVKKKVESIFKFREQALNRLFPKQEI
ncbi:hypothetical protein [Daejeonella sp.]|jgi:ligand-binding SRPBCC domain-containing protein|uniref:SRPBCC family protein n=1 Tax=Daejeonella sp. TaxID=2805397 RepID=UPI003784DEDC